MILHIFVMPEILGLKPDRSRKKRLLSLFKIWQILENDKFKEDYIIIM